jgi:hypothetical protein
LGGGVTCTPIALRGTFPGYVAEKERIGLDAAGIKMGLLFETSDGKRFAYLPALSSVSSALKEPEAWDGLEITV